MKFNIYKITSVMAGTVLMLGMTSCNDWLSVQPADQVEDTELLSSQSGYKEALAGVYSSMVGDYTYSKEMTFGAIAILADEWDNVPTSYQDLQKYDYSATSSENIFANMWSANYNSIANANNILKHIDGSQNLFTGDNYAIIKGECLGLRAFLHFDLLRCFGVSYAVNPEMPSIPYCTDFTYRVFPQLKVREVVEKILGDLTEAEKLLKVDPILTGREITEMDDAGYLMNRTVHFNYYAVKALQARVNMWAGNYTEAYNAAKAVYDADCFAWTAEGNMRSLEDRSYVAEQVFALNNVNLSYVADNYFSEDRNAYSFSITKNSRFNIYDGKTTDLRYIYGFNEGTVSDYLDNCYSTKYLESESSESWYQSKMPLIRISEMILIMAEAQFRNSGSGIDEINELRIARGVSPLDIMDEPFLDYLVKEYRREFIGEGQLFFLLKRLNQTYIPGTDIDAVANKSYTFPLPQAETEPGQRELNR